MCNWEARPKKREDLRPVPLSNCRHSRGNAKRLAPVLRW